MRRGECLRRLLCTDLEPPAQLVPLPSHLILSNPLTKRSLSHFRRGRPGITSSDFRPRAAPSSEQLVPRSYQLRGTPSLGAKERFSLREDFKTREAVDSFQFLCLDCLGCSTKGSFGIFKTARVVEARCGSALWIGTARCVRVHKPDEGWEGHFDKNVTRSSCQHPGFEIIVWASMRPRVRQDGNYRFPVSPKGENETVLEFSRNTFAQALQPGGWSKNG